MPRMGRPRKTDRDLPPGLYCYPGRNCYIRMTSSMKPIDLKTKDREKAKKIYWAWRPVWDNEQKEQGEAELAVRLDSAAKDPSGTTVSEYAKAWRESVLPTLLKKNGKPLAKKTRADYERICENQIEEHEEFKSTAIATCPVMAVKQFLSQWIGQPNYYNYVMAVCSHIFQRSADEGIRDDNPVGNVPRRTTARREVTCPMDDYLAITAKMEDWQARACDLIYLISHRPADVLRLKEPQIRYETRRRKGSNVRVVVISFTPTKNEQAMEISDSVDRDGGIEDTLQWFRAWKAAQGFTTAIKHVIVYPTSVRRRHIGKPVSRDYLSRVFAEAIVSAGLPKGKYKLRDLRKTGLNEEAVIEGKATNKGGHKTQQMQEYYVVETIPQRAKNNLSVLRPKVA